MSFVSFTSQRLWLNFKRHKLTFLISIFVFSILMLLFGLINPGPEGVAAYANIGLVQLLLGIGEVGVIADDLAIFFWFLIMSNIFTIIVPVFGIFLGIRMLPFNEKDGKELIYSTNKSIVRNFVENFALVVVLVPIILFPLFLIGTFFVGPSSEYVSGMAIAFFLPGFFMLVVAMITVFGASLKNSSRYGYAFGGFFFIYSFTLNLLSSEIDFATDINLMSQINSFSQGLAGKINWADSVLDLTSFTVLGQTISIHEALYFEYNRYIYTSILLVALLFIATIYFLYRVDYIETRTGYTDRIKGVGKGDILSKLSIVRRPMEPILSKLGWKYPAFRDQLQSSASTFLIYGIVTAMMIIMVLVAYPGDVAMNVLFTELNAIVTNPLVSAFLFGATPTATLEGFLVFKLLTFHWIYYFPFVALATYSIVMRDKTEGYDEITWSMPRKRSRIIMQRTLAMLIYLWIIVAINWVAFWIGEFMLELFVDVVAPDLLATIASFAFLGLGYSLFLVIFVSLALIPKQKYLILTLVGAFMVSIIVMVVPEVISELSFLAYLSPFQYFNVIGILLNDVNIIEEALPTIVVGGAIALVLYLGTVIFWTPRKDIA